MASLLRLDLVCMHFPISTTAWKHKSWSSHLRGFNLPALYYKLSDYVALWHPHLPRLRQHLHLNYRLPVVRMCPIPKISCCVLLCSDLTLLMLSWVYMWEHLMSPALFPALCSSLLRLCSSAHPRENRFSVILVMVALRAWKEGNPAH